MSTKESNIRSAEITAVKIDSELGRYTRVLVEIPARVYKEGKADE